MKVEFITELEKLARLDRKIFFLTGDLVFNAFEGIRDFLGERFINAGVAEQNMISVAAGLSSTGLSVWVYSISTFLTLKTVEQVRNDLCLAGLPVKLVGFGGGYGYGIMGETHHLLEDIAIYSSFQGIKVYVPAFSEDIPVIIKKMQGAKLPAYLRLNLVPKTIINLPKYSPLRKLSSGSKLTIVVLGPLIHNVLQALDNLGIDRAADVFCITEFPFEFSSDLMGSLKRNKKILIVEEHRGIGGLGDKIFSFLGKSDLGIKNYTHLYAKGYPSGRYGDHSFHQKENDLDPEGILKNIKKLIK
jgi:transketolase